MRGAAMFTGSLLSEEHATHADCAKPQWCSTNYWRGGLSLRKFLLPWVSVPGIASLIQYVIHRKSAISPSWALVIANVLNCPILMWSGAVENEWSGARTASWTSWQHPCPNGLTAFCLELNYTVSFLFDIWFVLFSPWNVSSFREKCLLNDIVKL